MMSKMVEYDSPDIALCKINRITVEVANIMMGLHM